MKQEIIEILKEIRPEFDFDENMNFVEMGMLDSFDMVILVNSLEEKYNIVIDGLDILPENFATVDAIETLINKQKK